METIQMRRSLLEELADWQNKNRASLRRSGTEREMDDELTGSESMCGD